MRIPRFPIGAVWQRAIAEGNASLLLAPDSDQQLLLPMALAELAEGAGPARPSASPLPPQPLADRRPAPGGGPHSLPNDAVQLRPSPGASSSWPHHPSPTVPPPTRNAPPPPPSRSLLGASPLAPIPSRTADPSSVLLPHWDDIPLVLLDGQRVRSATAAAGRARVQAGMMITEARARCAELRVATWDEETVARAVTRATAAFVQASPQVTPAAATPGTWWIGVSGLEALGGEAEVARHLLALGQRWHPGARVGIADSCVAARAATWASATGTPRGDEGIVIVPPGTCAPYLAPAPLGLVPMQEELRETLQALGLRTVGAFAALDAEDVERRWGEGGVAAWRLARGHDPRRPVLAHLDSPRAVATELCPSVPSVEPILFLVRAALDRLVAGLVQDGRAAAVVAITLSLDDARGALPTPTRPHTVTREVRLPRALARVVPLLERCRALLEDWTLQAPVCAVTVAVTATTPLHGAQGELLDPAWRDPAAADAAFARLRSALGTGAVVRPVLRDTHRPEAAGGWERVDDPGDGREKPAATTPRTRPSPGDHSPAPGRSTGTPAAERFPTPDVRQPARAPAEGAHLPLALVRQWPVATPPIPGLTHPPALRQLDPPERADVRTIDGTPRAIRWRQQVITVSRAIGPERLTGDWWSAGYARDYWRCEDATGTSDLVIYRDCTASDNAWYLHAWYD